MILIILMNAIFAAAIPLIKCAVIHATPSAMVAARMACGGIMVCLYALVMNHARLRWHAWRTLVWAGFINFYALCMLEAYALVRIDATLAALIWAQLPLVTAVIQRCLMGERLLLRQWAAVVCAVATGILLGWAESGEHCLNHQLDGVGVVMLVAAVILAGYGYLPLMRVVHEQPGLLFSHGLMMLVASGCALVTMIMCDQVPYLYNVRFFWGYSVVTALLVNAGGLCLQGLLLRRNYSPLLLACSSVMTPLFGICYGVVLLDEIWRPGYTLVLPGVLLSLSLWGWDKIGPVAAASAHQKTMG